MNKKLERVTMEGIYRCPICDFQQVHITGLKAEMVDGHIDFSILGSCENDHRFSESFTQHEGDTIIETKLLGKVYGH